MAMQHTCQDCDHVFNEEGQNGPHIQPAVQCPQCHSYRTQPVGIPDEANDMVHGIGAMPTSTQDDMSGNPLKEGILADGGWQNRDRRDESFASVRARVSLFETPEFETSQIVAPPDLFRHGLETEAAHRAGIQIPKGITDNLHTTLGNLGAWVENPYENGELRPYYNKYWKSIRPQFMKPGSLQIGVADPTMAEIVNHVAQTDDITPLYEYRGRESHVKTAGPLAALPEIAGLIGGGADAGAAAALAGGGDAAATAGAAEGASSAAGVGGIMNQVGKGALFQGGKNLMGGALNSVDDVLGFGGNAGGGGGPTGGPHDVSFYSRASSDEDDAFPAVHGETPKQEDGDYKQKDDGNSHEWQRDLSVNDIGGTDHSPSFDPGGPGMQRFLMLAPLLLQMIEKGEDGSQDPLVQGLHQTLESELPGYLDHADDNAAQHLVMILSPNGKPSKPGEAEPEKNEPEHADENAGGKHESKVVALNGDGAEFLPDFTVTPPALRHLHIGSPAAYQEIASLRHGLPEEVQREVDNLLIHQGPQVALQYLHQQTSAQPPGAGQAFPYWDSLDTNSTPMLAKTADTQGPHTPEQIQAVQQWLMDHGSEIGLQGDELIQTVLSVPTSPLEFADVLAQIQQSDPPPPPPEDAGMASTPPMPAQENAPPGATMPMPGMQQQMMSAVERYAADSVAGECPQCGGHTTALIDEDGSSYCHGCGATFKTEGKEPNKIESTSARLAAPDEFSMGGAGDASEPVHGVPIADQQHQRDTREERDSGHTWTDDDGAPLKVGQEYEMFSSRYDIPDLVRIEAVKPGSIVYTLTGEFGLEHSTELTREEANIERLSFKPTTQDGEVDAGGSLEHNDDDHTGYSGEPERTDASAPTGLVASARESAVVPDHNPKLDWLKVGGANFTPMEQRTLIDEPGMARNADALDLVGTHYDEADTDQFLFGC